MGFGQCWCCGSDGDIRFSIGADGCGEKAHCLVGRSSFLTTLGQGQHSPQGPFLSQLRWLIRCDEVRLDENWYVVGYYTGNRCAS